MGEKQVELHEEEVSIQQRKLEEERLLNTWFYIWRRDHIKGEVEDVRETPSLRLKGLVLGCEARSTSQSWWPWGAPTHTSET